MNNPGVVKKDIVWNINSTEYVVQNVPYVVTDEEDVLDFNVSITITALRDLMYEDQIPHIVDYEDYAHIEF
ncbi:hypothetical protein JOD43_002057 [Pullulanibacillus pueri]|uniref:hypothetical protein n=1 Tax=Pullulanibacillus pueri TaxID=1437324 RepID=UPI00166912AE|nr:hypothetical protein [Pullulanibacillus pueri]MBM7681885.1 hypothetical protein [Pullulanibacillus pueri]